MDQVNLAYTVGVHDCGNKVKSLAQLVEDRVVDCVRYNYWQGRPDTREPHAYAREADESQVEKVWRRKNDGSPPPAHMTQPMPLPSQT